MSEMGEPRECFDEYPGLAEACHGLAGMLGMRDFADQPIRLIAAATERIGGLIDRAQDLEDQLRSCEEGHGWDDIDPGFHDDDCDCELCCDGEDDDEDDEWVGGGRDEWPLDDEGPWVEIVMLDED